MYLLVQDTIDFIRAGEISGALHQKRNVILPSMIQITEFRDSVALIQVRAEEKISHNTSRI